MSLPQLLQGFLNGLSIGSVYAIFALGYTLVFSILGVINFSHGAVFTVGAYLTYTLMGGVFGFNGVLANATLGVQLPFAVALILASVLAGVLAVGIERVAFRPLRLRGADPLLTLVSSLGVAILVTNLIQYLVGAEGYSFPSSAVLGDLRPAVDFGQLLGLRQIIPVRTIQLVIIGVSAVILVILTLIINRSRFGKALRGVAEDATTASLLGINTDFYIMLTFFLSGFLGGVAGTLIGASVSIAGPYFGITFGLKGLAVIVLGGLGDIPGAVVGGLVIGLAEAFVPPQYSGYKDAVAFTILFVVLLIRPRGLLGRRVIEKV